MDKQTVDTYELDMVNGEGTPLRFVYDTKTNTVRYYDRRYPTQPDEPHYHPRNYNEHGQNCGPDMLTESFTDGADSGIRGWHEVDAWDIDRATVVTVGDWITMLKERGVGA